MKIRLTLLISLALVALLSACGESHEPAAQTSSSQSKTLLPTDPMLADLYRQSCLACHTAPSSGAPQTGNAEQWAPRLAKGKDVLLENTLSGFRGMPPLGSCMDCSEEEFIGLIDFMSSAQ